MQFIALVVKGKIDFVRLFTDNSRHAFKIGFGTGVGFEMRTFTASPDYDMDKSPFAITPAMLSYEYRVADKTYLGAYFNNYPDGNFFGFINAGLSVRRNF